jgi:hypothetical protein
MWIKLKKDKLWIYGDSKFPESKSSNRSTLLNTYCTKLSLQHKATDGVQHIMLKWMDMCTANTRSSVILDGDQHIMQMSRYVHCQYIKSELTAYQSNEHC